MGKIKRFGAFIVTISLAIFGVFLIMGNACSSIDLSVYAEEVLEGQTEEDLPPAEEDNETDDPSDEEADDNALKELIDRFLAGLKAKYGAEYETYYNAIIEKWGSIEKYLLALAEESPDAAASGWKAFVNWLGEYAPIWGSILAVAALIIVVVSGKAALGKVTNWATGTGGKFKIVFKSINKLYKSNEAEMKALMKLLGKNPQFDEERKALEDSIEEIEHDDE